MAAPSISSTTNAHPPAGLMIPNSDDGHESGGKPLENSLAHTRCAVECLRGVLDRHRQVTSFPREYRKSAISGLKRNRATGRTVAVGTNVMTISRILTPVAFVAAFALTG